MMTLDGFLNKPSAKTNMDLKASNVMLDVQPLTRRLEQLATVFDAWFRYEKLKTMHISIPGVEAVLQDFEELTNVLTYRKTRCDFLDALEPFGDFYRDFTLFHLNLSKLDERLWLQLEQAVGGGSTNADALEQPTGATRRALTTSDALALMNKFEAVSSRSDAHLARPASPNTTDVLQTNGAELDATLPTTSSLSEEAGRKPHDNFAWKGIEKLYFSVLKRLLTTLRDIQSDYELHKNRPPKIRNASPVIRHVLWAQLLQRCVCVRERERACVCVLSIKIDSHTCMCVCVKVMDR